MSKSKKNLQKILNRKSFLFCKDVNEFKSLLSKSGFIFDKNKDYSHFDSLFKGLFLEANSYVSVLTDSNTSLSLKQECLNNLHLSFSKDLSNVQFHIPKSLLSWIQFIDKEISTILEPKLLKHSYLVFLWNKSIGLNVLEPVIYSLRDSEKTIFFDRLILIFKASNYLNHSLGLMLAHCLSKSTFSLMTQSSKLTYNSFHSISSGNKILHDISQSLDFEKTSLISSISKDFLEAVPSLLKLAKNKILRKISLKGNNSLTDLEKDLFTQIDSCSWVPDDTDQAFFSEQIGLYFELQTDLFTSSLKPIANSPKTISVYTLSSDFIKALFVLKKESFQLPHILPLEDWEYSSKEPSVIQTTYHNHPESFSLHSGGPSYLSSKNVSAFIRSKHNCYAFAKPIDLDALNYMKSQPFKINTKFLDLLFNCLASSLLVYIYKIHPNPEESTYKDFERLRDSRLIETGIFNILNPTTLSLRTLNEFLDLNLKLKNLIREFSIEEESAKKQSLSNRILFLKKELTKEYLDALILIKTFFHTLFIACCFSDLSFFLNVNIDFRGRFYYLVFPLGIQNSNLGSSLLELDDTHFSNSNTLPEVHKLSSLYVLGLKPIKDYFTLLKFNSNLNSSFIGLDVTCSGLQIISGLIGFEEGLILTNLVFDSSNEDEKKDLYSNILISFLSAFPDNLTPNNLNISNNPKFQEEETETYNSYDESFSNRLSGRSSNIDEDNYQNLNLLAFVSKNTNIIKAILKAFKNIFTRNIIKYWAMRLVYSEGSRSRAVELMGFYNEQKNNFPSAPRTLIFKIAMFLSDLFKNILYRDYTGFGDFVAFCQKHIVSKTSLDKNKGVWLTCSNTHLEVFFTQFKFLTKRYYHLNKDGKTVSFSYNAKSNVINYAGHSRSLLPNFIHFLDSRLMTLIVINCKKRNIPIFTNHDCFYVPIRHGNDLKNIYFSCFKELILDNDCLYSFFNSNSVSSNDYEPFLLEINNRKKIIISRLELKQLLPSFFILS